MENTNSAPGWVIGLILFLMFVVLPGGSWYYLQAGTKFRKELLDKLEHKGAMPLVKGTNFDGTPINSLTEQKGLFIVTFSDFRDAPLSQSKIALLQKLHQQFDVRKDVFFLNLVPDSSFFDPAKLNKFVSKNNLSDAAQFLFLQADAPLTKDDFHFSYKKGETEANNSYFALVDFDREIRSFYDVTQQADQELLVKHLAILLPTVKKRKVAK